FYNKGQPQGIAPTQCHVGAIPCGCPLSVFFKYLKIYGSVLMNSNSNFKRQQAKAIMFLKRIRFNSPFF
ncbi:MAG: hypothetical protein DRR00_19970, partial [Candidatus Parabeggiatoa sp. nov. 3]